MSRYKFYQRCGFLRLNAKIVEAKITFDVMAYGGEVNPESYNKIDEKISRQNYVALHQNRNEGQRKIF